jgi:cytochrome c553
MIMNNKINIPSVALLSVLLLFAGVGIAEGDIAAGKVLAYTCLGCYGIEGYRNAYPSYRVPKLGGQKATYTELALKGYRDGDREHPTMQAQAALIAEEDLKVLVRYYSRLDGLETTEVD